MPLENGMMWRVITQSSFAITHDEYKLLGDTILMSKSYKKILNTKFTLNQPGPSGTFWKGYIREDTLNKRVFWNNGVIDNLVYDFGLQVGDTIQGIMLDYLQDSGVDTIRLAYIDSIQLNGVYHKVFIQHQ